MAILYTVMKLDYAIVQQIFRYPLCLVLKLYFMFKITTINLFVEEQKRVLFFFLSFFTNSIRTISISFQWLCKTSLKEMDQNRESWGLVHSLHRLTQQNQYFKDVEKRRLCNGVPVTAGDMGCLNVLLLQYPLSKDDEATLQFHIK